MKGTSAEGCRHTWGYLDKHASPSIVCQRIWYNPIMTTLLEQAVAQARQLPDSDQDALARLILAEIEAEAQWEELFSKHPEKVARLADKAWADHEAGNSEPLDPDRL